MLITVDALRADHLGLYGYHRATSPNVDRWFSDGVIFENAYSTQSNTAPSVVSLLTGLYPQEHGVRLLYQLVSPRLALLPDHLPEAYRSAAFVSNFVLTDEATGLASRFDHYDDFVDEGVPGRPTYERSARRTTDAVLEWAAENREPGRPLFLWIHYIDPHGPYHPPAAWRTAFDHDRGLEIAAEQIPDHQRFDEITDALEYVDLYDEEIAYVDAEIGRLLEGLDELMPLGDGFVFFTADHGESMMEHERWFSHGYHVYEEIIRVPLMIRGPGLPAARRRGLVSGIDVAPTILGLTGGTELAATRGIDLLSAEASPADRVIFAEATRADYQWRAALQGDRRWMARLHRESPDIAEARFYDLEVDGKQELPRSWQDSASAVARLRELIAEDPDPAGWPSELRSGVKLNAPKVAPRAEGEALEKLRALGYVD